MKVEGNIKGMTAIIARRFKAAVMEVSIETNGFSFLCLIGTHVNGGYISILTLGVCAELTHYEDGVGYNADRIFHALKYADDNRRGMVAGREREIANAISKEVTPLIAAMYGHKVQKVKERNN